MVLRVNGESARSRRENVGQDSRSCYSPLDSRRRPVDRNCSGVAGFSADPGWYQNPATSWRRMNASASSYVIVATGRGRRPRPRSVEPDGGGGAVSGLEIASRHRVWPRWCRAAPSQEGADVVFTTTVRRGRRGGGERFAARRTALIVKGDIASWATETRHRGSR
jgi:hypothetical protein